MAIRHVDELKNDATGAALLMVDGENHEGLFHKCPETGNVELKFVEPPVGKTAVLVLQDGNNSTYQGQIHEDGRFGQ